MYRFLRAIRLVWTVITATTIVRRISIIRIPKTAIHTDTIRDGT
jgi:hypothetical protein